MAIAKATKEQISLIDISLEDQKRFLSNFPRLQFYPKQKICISNSLERDFSRLDFSREGLLSKEISLERDLRFLSNEISLKFS